ncbi:5'-3' exonuclease H3TH domain-containing protein [Gallaecimonas pentaromativorans]|uniref:Protein Xni n=1 Tax=Gallaecimonas pentaromativorans TaxID=584787 RepID=A0A3N1PNE3_9GAMM|nr:5'-3' exonuclease H3TH domain-containing protein [Gallaecimonas pentaromativorans]ROQ28497.1 protein Xni [Gallaecimonas pentaromativorans]
MPRLVLIDALNLIRRLHAANSAQVVAACDGAWQRIAKALEPSHALAVFDGKAPSWRYQHFADYKAGRSPMPEDLVPRLGDIATTWQKSGLKSWFPEAEEADDLIASTALAARSHNVAVAVVSTDKGYAQLLDAGVVQYDPFGRQFLGAQHWQQKLGISPSQLTDYLALTGDSTNAVPGVSGVGAKTAAQLLGQYRHLADILASEADDKAVLKVKADAKAALLAKTLATLRGDLPLPFGLSDLRRG